MAPRDRDNSELTDIPQMTPARDELVQRRSGSGASNKAGSSVSHNGSGGLLTLLTFILSITALGASYFLYEQSVATQQSALQAEARIADLEAQLTSTGDELTQSDAAVRVKLKELDSEVRKLWDSRKKANAAAKEQNNTVKNLTTRTGKTRSQLESASAQLTALTAEVDEVIEMLEGANFSTQAQRIEQAAKTLQRLSNDYEALAARVSANEEWVASINAFRRQVNEKLGAASSQSAQPVLQ